MNCKKLVSKGVTEMCLEMKDLHLCVPLLPLATAWTEKHFEGVPTLVPNPPPSLAYELYCTVQVLVPGRNQQAAKRQVPNHDRRLRISSPSQPQPTHVSE